MNVLHVVNSLEIGGLEKVVVNLTCQMSQVNHTVVCLTVKGDLFNEISGDCFCLNKPPGLIFSTIPRIKKIIREKSIDIIHTHNQGPQFYGSVAGKLSGKPVIHTKHGQNPLKTKSRYCLEKFSSFLTNRIVTVSENVRDICLQRLRIPASKLVTILNGVDTNKFYHYTGKTQIQQGKPFIIGTVARLSPEKNHSYLLDACERLAENNINFQLRIVGDGPLRGMLTEKSNQLNLQNNVVFEGSRNDIPQAMNEFDLFVLPSLTEGVSLTLLEAMSCELPIVATAVGGTPEVVVDGVTGILVPSDNSELLAEKIKMCMNDSELCQTMGLAGRKRVVENFSIENTVASYFDLYQQCMGR